VLAAAAVVLACDDEFACEEDTFDSVVKLNPH
jgi:hypothetical protein